MGKASLNKTKIGTTQAASIDKVAPKATEPTFSSGDLGQLQEILFGQQQRSTHEQISTIQRQFDERLSSLSNMLNSRLNQLTETVEKYQKNFEDHVIENKSNNESALENINQKIGATKVELQTDINTLSESTKDAVKRLDTGFAKHKTKLLREINDNKRELQIGQNKSINDLHCTKLDKQDLAQLLSDVSDKLSDVATTPQK